MDGVLGRSWGMYISVKRYMYCATRRYAMQVFCGRLGMHTVEVYIVGVCVGVGTCGRRYSR